MKISRKQFLRHLPAAGVFQAVVAESVRAQEPHALQPRVLRLVHGSLTIDDKTIKKDLSVWQSPFKFLYFYAPERGLFILSDVAFPNAIEAGEFNGTKLTFRIYGVTGSLSSATPILGENRVPAWVSYDAGFRLDKQIVMFGYGDSERAPYDWPSQLRSAGR
jgi:hypothetical protein